MAVFTTDVAARVLDSVEEAVIATDLDGRVTFWSRHAERLYGWSADEAIGHDIVALTPSARSVEEGRAIMRRLLAGESWHGEFVVRRRDGSTFTALVTDAPLRDTDGNMIGVVGVSTDISDRLWTERALRETMRAREQFLAEISHDLQSPLAAALTRVRVLARRLRAGKADIDIGAELDKVEANITRVARQVRELLDAASHRVGQPMSLDRSEFRAAELVREVVESLPELERHPVEVTVDDELIVRWDRERMFSVFANLLSNAAKYGGPGTPIRILLAPDGDTAWVGATVSDDGPGIAQADRDRIFDPFFRSERETARGSGLGLATVRRIVESHGGTIALAESARGATFVLRVPRQG